MEVLKMAVKHLIIIIILSIFKVDSMKLDQVVILSRHNIRAPLSKNLQRFTSLEWPSWVDQASYLTVKGVLLEEYMGEYFAQWLKENNLFSSECPEKDSVYIYSNVRHRTIETAKSFTRTAFKNCNISVDFHIQNVSDHPDPVFAPILRNNTDAFKESYYRNMREKLGSLHLEDAYLLLDQIIDLKNSDACKHEFFCDFIRRKDDILYAVGAEPDIYGPLSIGNHIVDFFLMSYYNGMPNENVAWGKINSEDDWRKLLEITKENQKVRFHQPHALSKDIAKPMLQFLKQTFLNKDFARKLTMLVGHDSNLNSVMAALGFKNYNLEGQYELTPIGGKLVFQKWSDENSNSLFKIEYIYQTMKQLRDGAKLSEETPPFSQVMEIEGCKVDVNGFCAWNDFVKVLENI